MASVMAAVPPLPASDHPLLAKTDPLAQKPVGTLHGLTDHPLLMLKLRQPRNCVLFMFDPAGVPPVSYTHLRAHET